MRISLQLHGQLRTFQKALPSLLKFIDYYKQDYDVFLLIDKGTVNVNKDVKSNYSEANLQLLKDMLLESRIKLLKFTDEFTAAEKERENELYDNYHKIHAELSRKYNKNFTKDNFVSRLIYRKHLLNEYKNQYCAEHNITYDYAVVSRFDIGSLLNMTYTINDQTTPLMCSDALTIARPEFINVEQSMVKPGLDGKSNFPFTPRVFFDADYNLKPDLLKKYAHYSPQHGNEFLQDIWVFMPELNYRLYVLEQGLTFIEGWHQGGVPDFPHNFGFRLIRD